MTSDREKPIRGRQLGTDFEKAHIEEILSAVTASQHTGKYISSISLITDLESCIKAQQNVAYARKVKVGNLQKMADTLTFLSHNNIKSMDSLEHMLLSTSEDLNIRHKALKHTEANLTQVNQLIKNTGQYLAYKDIYHQYLNSKNKKQFREHHRAELSLYEAARKYLQENAPGKIPDSTGKIKFRTPDIKQLKKQKSELTTLKNQQYEEYSYVRAKYRELQTVHSNLVSILHTEQFNRKSKEQSL